MSIDPQVLKCHSREPDPLTREWTAEPGGGPFQNHDASPFSLEGSYGLGARIHVVHRLCRKFRDFTSAVILRLHVDLSVEGVAGNIPGKNHLVSAELFLYKIGEDGA